MPTIRSFDPANLPATVRTQASEAARAQRLAMFQKAIAGAASPTPAPTTAPAISMTPVHRVASTVDVDPARALRPGSLLDIRV